MNVYKIGTNNRQKLSQIKPMKRWINTKISQFDILDRIFHFYLSLIHFFLILLTSSSSALISVICIYQNPNLFKNNLCLNLNDQHRQKKCRKKVFKNEEQS